MYMASNFFATCLSFLCTLLLASTATATSPHEGNPAAAIIAGDYASSRGMVEMDDSSLGHEVAQAGGLILADRIAPNSLTGAGTADTYANFSYYRMGLDAKLGLNANISKLQLGCGGVNDLLNGPSCDLDIDYVGFMGLNAAGDKPGAPGSLFEMTRPFIEIAVKNENNPALREVVGFRIGAQSINGALRMGRDYTNQGFADATSVNGTITNQESGLANCNPSKTAGSLVGGCHSGINSLSGYLAGLEISAGMPASMVVNVLGITSTYNADACLGRIDYNGVCSVNDNPFFVDAGGTRIKSLNVRAAPLELSLVICVTAYGGLNIGLNQVHYLTTPKSSDFFLSFQRERVSWPRYTKTTPSSDLAALLPSLSATDPRRFDSCNSAYGQVTARCGSAYSPAANTGWWLSASNAKIMNLRPTDRINAGGPYTVGDLLSALSPANSPIIVDNPKLDMIAADNCYGTARFC